VGEEISIMSVCLAARLSMDIPMVQMMLVRLNARGGLYSVLRFDSHSARVLPKAWWSRELAIVYTVVEEISWECPSLGVRLLGTHGRGDAVVLMGKSDELLLCEGI
jgi:hypothetical protein